MNIHVSDTLRGLSLIGSARGAAGTVTFTGVNPATGEALAPVYHAASSVDVDSAVALASAAAAVLAHKSGAEIGELLRAIAAELEDARADFEILVPRETALPVARANGELSRTQAQLRLFADLAEESSWVDARIDHADAGRQPLPKPDLRSMRRPLGPVAVFGASNFPLAFSVAGGDTASALAAGCPVIVKAHPSHPATSERAGLAIRAAVEKCGFPEGTFSLLFDPGIDVGKALVRHAGVQAVGFTGSRSGGRALMDLAAARAHPIPVFAEMGSINPVFVLPAALSARAESIATALHASVMQGVGQFCTSPGVIVLPQGAAGDVVRDRLATLFAQSMPAPMLNAGIAARYAQGAHALSKQTSVRALGEERHRERWGAPRLLETSARDFLAQAALREEVFGPLALLVRIDDAAHMARLASELDGQLTATVFADEADHALAAPLLAVLETRVGRVLMNGVPTGVEVCAAMVHGGPYPATSDGSSTSVGTAAIERFARRVCWQNVPDALLPAALQEANPLRLARLVDGKRRT
jgi:alpha-ketoglutaric semialdehyde dehydrogenase